MDAALSVSAVVITAVTVYVLVRWARTRGSRSRGTSIAGNIMKLYNEMYMPSAAKSIEQRMQSEEAGAAIPAKGKQD
jgi:hypothetical protein